MKSLIRLVSFALLCPASLAMAADEAAPVKALLVTGGCCHDYPTQKTILPNGISERAGVPIDWTVVFEGGDSRDHMVSIYNDPDWAKPYDIVVHNECYGGVTDDAFVERITAAHAAGVPAVTIHCSTHSYRNAKTDEWRKLLGVSSFNHGPKHPIKVTQVLEPHDHPVLKGFPMSWTTPDGELYNIDRIWPGCTPLAIGTGGEKKANTCVWVNEYGKARVFGTTLGHHNETMLADEYLDLVTRGFLWALGRLGA